MTTCRWPYEIAVSLVCTLLMVTCRAADTERTSLVTDSAGVELVFSAVPAAAAGEAWSISGEPVAEIRPAPFDSAALLYSVVGVSVLPDGRIAVANLGDNTIRFYDIRGTLLRKVGGSGEGPGEFRQIRGLVHRENELWAYQILPHPTQVYDLEGTFLRSVREAQALGPTLFVATGDTLVYTSFSNSWDIAVWHDTVLVRRVRLGVTPAPVTADHRAAYRETLLDKGAADPRLRQAYQILADQMLFPDHHPLHSRMVHDQAGMLWVERPQTEPPWSEAIDYAPVPARPSTWDVISPGGEWLSTVVLPGKFRVLEIGDDYVAGVAKDDMDVEEVVVWGLDRSD